MADKQEKQNKEQAEKIDMKMLGKQGNTGLYGQGQYDSEGNPDLRTKQAQQLLPDQGEKQGETEQQDVVYGQNPEQPAQPTPKKP